MPLVALCQLPWMPSTSFLDLKIPSSCISDPHIQFMSANSLNKKDVVVAISQSGNTAALVESIKTVKSFGVIVIGLMPSGTPLSRICDIALDIDVGENARLTRPLTSRLAYMAIIDVLAVGVAQLKPEAHRSPVSTLLPARIL